jgi:hypothetical protein
MVLLFIILFFMVLLVLFAGLALFTIRLETLDFLREMRVERFLTPLEALLAMILAMIYEWVFLYTGK